MCQGDSANVCTLWNRMGRNGEAIPWLKISPLILCAHARLLPGCNHPLSPMQEVTLLSELRCLALPHPDFRSLQTTESEAFRGSRASAPLLLREALSAWAPLNPRPVPGQTDGTQCAKSQHCHSQLPSSPCPVHTSSSLVPPQKLVPPA